MKARPRCVTCGNCYQSHGRFEGKFFTKGKGPCNYSRAEGKCYGYIPVKK